jgi:cell division protein FtsB
MSRAQRHAGAKKLHEKLLRQLLGPLLLSAGIFYFSFHALSGERGLYALLKEERKLEVLKTELADVNLKRKTLEHSVRLMSAGSLDLDLLDEQARINLNEASEDEVIVPLVNPGQSETAPHAE